jgi:hypothetical protein
MGCSQQGELEKGNIAVIRVRVDVGADPFD